MEATDARVRAAVEALVLAPLLKPVFGSCEMLGDYGAVAFAQALAEHLEAPR